MRRLKLIGSVLMAVGVSAGLSVIVAHSSDLASDTPTPALLHPIERIAFSTDWRSRTVRHVVRGGHVFLILRTGVDPCVPITVGAEGAQLYAMHPTRITAPSSRGSKTGLYYDALIPRSAANCALSPYVFADWAAYNAGPVSIQVGETQLKVDVKVRDRAAKPKRKLHIATTNFYLVKGHCRAYCPREGELAVKYAQALLEHGTVPIQNWVRLPPIKDGLLDLDRGSEKSASFRQTTLNFAGAGAVGFPRMTRYRDPVAYLQALEATVQQEDLVGRAWVFALDEPKISQNVIDRLKMYRLFAPSVKIMVTTGYDPRLADLVDIFAPVYNQLYTNRGPNPADYGEKTLWTYASCMGSCGPNRKRKFDVPKRPGPDTGLPDFLIDRPAERLFTFFRTVEETGTDGALYYEATEAYPLAAKGLNLLEDPWNFGGNGDGLLFYPGRPSEFGLTEHQPLPSLRLKLIRYAIETYWS